MRRSQYLARRTRALVAVTIVALLATMLTAPTASAQLDDGHGTITGTVTDEAGTPLADICVEARGPGGFRRTATVADGTYDIEELAPGEYTVLFDGCDEPWAHQYYDGTRDDALATPVEVAVGETTAGIDAQMAPTGSISGRVVNSDGAPVPGICVWIDAVDGLSWDQTETDADGRWREDGLASGDHTVHFSGCGGQPYASEWFPGVDEVASAGHVRVIAPLDTAGVDAVLRQRDGWIRGQITDRDTGAPVHTCVSAVSTLPSGQWETAWTDDAGDYHLAGLAAGTYTVTFSDCADPSPYVSRTVAAVEVGEDTGTTIDTDLVVGTTISGTVTGADPSDPLEGVCVEAALADGQGYSQVTTSGDGTYELTGIPDGDVFVSFTDCLGWGYVTEWWDGQPTRDTADPVTVADRTPVNDVDVQMQPGGTITGTVTMADGRRPRDICVRAERAADGHVEWGYVFAEGGYHVYGLPAGSYQVLFYDCRTGPIVGALGDVPAVAVTAGDETSGIDQELAARPPLPDHNPAVVLSAGPAEGAPPLTMRLALDADDPDGGPLRYILLPGDGSPVVVGDIPEPYATVVRSHPYGEAGTYQATAVVFDAQGNATPAGATVEAGRPVPTASLAVTPTSGSAPLSVTADIGGTAPDGGLLTYSLDFGDGSDVITGELPRGPINHLYGQTGEFTVTLVVDEGLVSATATATVVVTDLDTTTTSLQVTPATSVHGQQVTLQAEVATAEPPATGTVTFAVDGTDVGTVDLAAGKASLPVRLDAGARTITARYSGSPAHLPSEASLTRTVAKAETAVAASSSPNPVAGRPVTLAATVAVPAPGQGMPTGQVTFLDGTETLGTATVGADGTASLIVPSLDLGSHSITATYVGDANFGGDISDVLTLQVRQATQVLAGVDRIDTSILASQAEFPQAGSAEAVVLARADDFPDALAGVPLAAHRRAPLLLSTSNRAPAAVLDEIGRVLAPGGQVLVLGGVAALSAEVESALVQRGHPVRRFFGDTRYETAVAIARDGIGDPQALLLVSGRTFADALSAGPAAAAVDGAILLTDDESMPAVTSTYRASKPGIATYAVGGPAARAAGSAVALMGDDRYATAVEVAKRFFPSPSMLGVATGMSFADGTSGGAVMAARGGPLLMVAPNQVPSSVAGYVHGPGSSANALMVFGGEHAVTPSVRQAIEAALAGG